MKRYPHYWYPLRGKTCPPRISVLSCHMAGAIAGIRPQPCADRVCSFAVETAQLRNGVCERRQAYVGEGAEQCLSALTSLCNTKGTTWVFVDHAFDTLAAIGFWDHLAEGRIRLAGRDWTVDRGDGQSGEDRADGLCCIEDPPTLVLCGAPPAQGRLLILDTRNYGIESDNHGTGCSERAAVLLEGLCSILRTLREGVPVSLRGTAASQAVQILRTRHDVRRLHCHTHPQCTQLERAAYFGGRVEVYRDGAIPGPVYHVDVRSMYPSIGLTLPVPVSLREYTDDTRRARWLVQRFPGECCASVVLRDNAARYPVRSDGEIVYPDGRVDTALCGPELQEAESRGIIDSVRAASRYACAPVLSGFYQWGLQLQQTIMRYESPVLVQFLKRVMNGLVGKFGEPGRRWVGCPSRTEMGPYDEWIARGQDGESTRYRNIGWHTQRLERHGESYWSIPAIAGWITSAGRVRLGSYHKAAGRENVWYVDTDALLCNKAGYDRLLRAGFIRDGETGHLRLVGCHSECTIHGVRHYQLGDTIKCAGVPRGAIGPGETREDYGRRAGITTETPLGRLRRRNEQPKA